MISDSASAAGFRAEARLGGHQAGQPEHLGVQDPVRDPALGAADHLLVVGGLTAAQLGVQGVERRLAGGVDEDPVHVREGVVAGGALAFEAGGKRLPRLEDLLDQQVAPPVASRSRRR